MSQLFSYKVKFVFPHDLSSADAVWCVPEALSYQHHNGGYKPGGLKHTLQLFKWTHQKTGAVEKQ